MFIHEQKLFCKIWIISMNKDISQTTEVWWLNLQLKSQSQINVWDLAPKSYANGWLMKNRDKFHTRLFDLHPENWFEGYPVKSNLECKLNGQFNFEFWINGQFSISKINPIFLSFFSLKNTNLGAHFMIDIFCCWHFW